jgi:hypothetical protein
LYQGSALDYKENGSGKKNRWWRAKALRWLDFDDSLRKSHAGSVPTGDVAFQLLDHKLLVGDD